MQGKQQAFYSFVHEKKEGERRHMASMNALSFLSWKKLGKADIVNCASIGKYKGLE